ncbi:hypothetical protein D3C77_664530 [compost metagenome]
MLTPDQLLDEFGDAGKGFSDGIGLAGAGMSQRHCHHLFGLAQVLLLVVRRAAHTPPE